jgi:N-acetylneuraminic acid mutarotase
MDGVHWELAPNTIAWSPRAQHAGVVHDGAMYLLGGSAPEGMSAEVYRSTDGVDWTPVTRNAPWSGRRGHAVVKHQDAMWLLGGSDGAQRFSDVWKSTDGENWELVTAAAPWVPRYFHAAAAFHGRIWVMGGVGAENTLYNDIWSSADGETWRLESAAASWGARHSMGLTLHRKRLWLLGGGRFVNQPQYRYSLPDVWYTDDGVHWTLATESGPTPRYGAGLCNHAGRLWAVGGFKQITGPYSIDPEYHNDVWTSYDGITWTQTLSDAPWPARMGLVSLVYDDKLWLLGGENGISWPIYLNDVWVSGGDLGAHTADQNADYAFDLSELLRIIQLYNSGAFHCEAATEDGYAPGPGDQSCAPHASDYDGPDGQFSLSEVLRAVQFYNAPAGIMPCDTSEDGWCPVVY